MALKCYFQQLLSYKYLLFFFSSFPPGEKGRGPIENSALSLSVGFKYRSNNRSLLLFFFKFPVVLLAGSAVASSSHLQILSGLCCWVCVRVYACTRAVWNWGREGGMGGVTECVSGPLCPRPWTLLRVQTLIQNLRREEIENPEKVEGWSGHC